MEKDASRSTYSCIGQDACDRWVTCSSLAVLRLKPPLLGRLKQTELVDDGFLACIFWQLFPGLFVPRTASSAGCLSIVSCPPGGEDRRPVAHHVVHSIS
jgi:hypothetical protein